MEKRRGEEEEKQLRMAGNLFCRNYSTQRTNFTFKKRKKNLINFFQTKLSNITKFSSVLFFFFFSLFFYILHVLTRRFALAFVIASFLAHFLTLTSLHFVWHKKKFIHCYRLSLFVKTRRNNSTRYNFSRRLE